MAAIEHGMREQGQALEEEHLRLRPPSPPRLINNPVEVGIHGRDSGLEEKRQEQMVRRFLSYGQSGPPGFVNRR